MIIESHEKFLDCERHYWQYYKELEREVLSTRRYVDFDEENFSAFSIEYLKLFQAICSEIDAIGKEIAKALDPSFKSNDRQNNIFKWWFIIQDGIMFPVGDDKLKGVAIEDTEVRFNNDIPIRPWENFRTELRTQKNGNVRTEVEKGKQVPEWWKAYNKVKHHRTSMMGANSNKLNYSRANLGNVAKAISALYILETSYMNALGTKTDIEAFADHSVLFEKIEYTTSEDIKKMIEENPPRGGIKK